MFATWVLIAATVACDPGTASHHEVVLKLVQDLRVAESELVAKALQSADKTALDASVARAEAARAALARADGPSPAELIAWLRSGDPSCRDGALAVVVAKRLVDDAVAEAVLATYSEAEPRTLRGDTLLYASSVLDARGRQRHFPLVGSVVCREPDPGLLSVSVVPAQALEPEQAGDLYACYLMHGGTALRKIAYTFLKGMGRATNQHVRSLLVERRATDALRFLDQQDAGTSPAPEHPRDEP